MSDALESCLRVGQSPDCGGDGWYVAAADGAGTYCRPGCPTLVPAQGPVRRLPTAFAARGLGLHPCPRCRPDHVPGSPMWAGRDDPVGRAMRSIADGVADRADEAALAARLGCSAAALRDALVAETGLDAAGLAAHQRAQTARLLLDNTDLPLSTVALAAGFPGAAELTHAAVAALGPQVLRRAGSPAAGGPALEAPVTVSLRLPVLGPFAFAGVFGHLAASAVPGCEEVRDGALRRTLRLPHGRGVVSLRPHPDHVWCRLRLGTAADLTAAIAACRRLLDLDADPQPVIDALSTDPLLAPLIAAAPGQRLPRSVDGAETAIRVVLGQQVSLKAARTHAGRLVHARGEPIDDPDGGLTHVFPSPQQLADLDPAALALPHARRRTLLTLVAALADGRIVLDGSVEHDAARRRLLALPGIGPWTAEVVAMRGLGDPDAFPATDLGLRAAAAQVGLPPAPAPLTAHAERWRPWRAYAVQQLWAAFDHPVNHWPPREAA